MKLVIIDGQSGRMGALLAERIKAAKLPCEVLAIGTNAIATAAMMKAGADQGATGENPVLVACRTADVIAGPIGILSEAAAAGEPSLRPHRGGRPGPVAVPAGGRIGGAPAGPVRGTSCDPVNLPAKPVL